MHIYTPKVIADPIYGIVDIRPVLPMVETREFQALADKRQLGLSHLVFPSATHTRMAHSLGTYHTTHELAKRWVELEFIDEHEARALAGYALYHDIGHPALSHITEALCKKRNDELSLDIAKEKRKEVEKAGIDFDLVISLMKREHPLHVAVKDKNLGMDKLDYLERDGAYTVLSRPAGIDYLRRHIYYIDETLAIDEKVVDNAIEVQKFYLKMYKNVYLRKNSVIAQRMMQKMVYFLIEDGDISADELPHTTDSVLVGKLAQSTNPMVQTLYQRFSERNLFREAIVVRPETFAETHRSGDKPIAVLGVTEREIQELTESENLQSNNQVALRGVEQRISEIAGLPEEDVLVVAVFDSWRFAPTDIAVYSPRSGFYSLKKQYPAHFADMQETAQSYTAFRICTTSEHRKKLSNPKLAKKIIAAVQKFA